MYVIWTICYSKRLEKSYNDTKPNTPNTSYASYFSIKFCEIWRRKVYYLRQHNPTEPFIYSHHLFFKVRLGDFVLYPFVKWRSVSFSHVLDDLLRCYPWALNQIVQHPFGQLAYHKRFEPQFKRFTAIYYLQTLMNQVIVF